MIYSFRSQKNTNYDQIPDLWAGPCVTFLSLSPKSKLARCMNAWYIFVFYLYNSNYNIYFTLYMQSTLISLYHFWLLVSVKRPVFDTLWLKFLHWSFDFFQNTIYFNCCCTMMLFAVMLNQVALYIITSISVLRSSYSFIGPSYHPRDDPPFPLADLCSHLACCRICWCLPSLAWEHGLVSASKTGKTRLRLKKDFLTPPKPSSCQKTYEILTSWAGLGTWT